VPAERIKPAQYGTAPRTLAWETWRVTDRNWDDCHADPQLPQRGTPHPANTNLVVYDIQPFKEVRPGVHFVRLLYLPPSFNLPQIRGSEAEVTADEDFELPVLSSDTGTGPLAQIKRRFVKRGRMISVESRLVGAGEGELRAAKSLLLNNLGCWYLLPRGQTFNQIPGILISSRLRLDRSNLVFADVRFLTTGWVRAIPAGSYLGQTLALPELPPLAEYNADFNASGVASVAVKLYTDIYRQGQVIPWL